MGHLWPTKSELRFAYYDRNKLKKIATLVSKMDYSLEFELLGK
jgi:hypothetical protein